VYRSRSNQKFYEKRQQKPGCPFCDPAEIDHRLLEETEYAYVIPNQPTYEVWEHHKVLDNLMVIPKRHVPNLNELNDDELLNVARIVARYESNGYSVYARANDSPRRTVTHQHTHLIKIDKKSPRLSLYLRKPYFLVRF
jgi:diadenosine tetraphosphate (Ap4A) HIT family hydrolase